MSEQFEGHIQEATAADAALISAEIRGCYGDTYTSPEVLDPTWVREEIASGRAVYVIARTPAGEVAGVAALVKSAPGLWDCCRAVVDPRGRSRGVCTALIDHLLVHIAPGLRARFVYADLVTSHVYAQRHSLSRGFIPTGLLLGMAPATLTPVGIPAPEQDVSIVLGVKRFSATPRPRVLSLEGRDLERALDLLDRLRIPARRSRMSTATLRFSATASHLPAYGITHVQLGAGCGTTLAQAVALPGLRPRLTWVDVPVEFPGAWAEVERLRELGFGWGAYVPLAGQGQQDVLRMQRVEPGVRIDPQLIQVLPELESLRDEIISDVMAREVVLA